MKPDEIAAELGMSRYLVTQMLLAATNRGKP
jgi:DNA-binding transcriptional regulator LsrR (DeoR family)